MVRNCNKIANIIGIRYSNTNNFHTLMSILELINKNLLCKIRLQILLKLSFLVNKLHAAT